MTEFENIIRPLSHAQKQGASGPGRVGDLCSNGPPTITPDRGHHRAKLCCDDEHIAELKGIGIEMTHYCLICAIGEVADEAGIDEYQDGLREFAFDEASVSRSAAEDIAECAAEHPGVFLQRFRLYRLGLQIERVERARQEVRGAYAELAEEARICRKSGFKYTAEKQEAIASQLASALALLEEMS